MENVDVDVVLVDVDLHLDNTDAILNQTLIEFDLLFEAPYEEQTLNTDVSLRCLHQLVQVAGSTEATRSATIDFLCDLFEHVLFPSWRHRIDSQPYLTITWPLLSTNTNDECSVDTLCFWYRVFKDCAGRQTTTRLGRIVAEASNWMKRHGLKLLARKLSNIPAAQRSLELATCIRWINETVDQGLEEMSRRNRQRSQTIIVPDAIRAIESVAITDEKLSFFGTLPCYLSFINDRLTRKDSSGFVEGCESVRWHALVNIQERLLGSLSN